MASIDSLPADQRAVLELVLRRGRSYDEIARLLSIDRAGVRQRALAAFDALGPRTRIPADRRALIADYLLDALPAGVADEVREHLRASGSERNWARAIAADLQGLSDRPLPEIPTNGHRTGAPARGRKPARAEKPAAETQTGRKREPAAEVPVRAALSNGAPGPKEQRRPSRLGGAILLGLLAAVAIALVLVLVVFTGGSSRRSGHRAASAAGGRTTRASSSSPKLLGQVNLKPPGGGKSPAGLAYVVSVQNQVGMLIAAEGLAPNTKHPADYYALWLYNSPSDNRLLGFVTPAVGKNGQFRVPTQLPTDAAHFRTLLVTLETTASPKRPGRIVLQGTGKL